MAVADITKSVPHVLEQFVGLTAATDDVPIKAILKFTGATSNPTDITAGGANTCSSTTGTFTATGVAVGDVVLGYGVVSGLVANAFIAGVYVSATDTITVLFVSAPNTGPAVAATTMNFIVADVT